MMQNYIQRLIYPKLVKSLDKEIITMITGPRQVGKSTIMQILIEYVASLGISNKNGTIALSKNNFSYSLDDIALRTNLRKDIKYIENDINLSLGKSIYDIQEKIYIFIDEIQKYPKLLDWIKQVFDKNSKYIKFVLVGSSALDLKDSLSESLAGRVEYIHLYPILYRELLKHKTQTDTGGIYHILDSLLENAKPDNMLNVDTNEENIENIFAQELSSNENIDISKLEKIIVDSYPRFYTSLKNLNTTPFYTTLELLYYGGLPRIYQTPIKERIDLLKNYINIYLEKEVGSLTRNLDLELFGLSLRSFAEQNGEPLNLNNVAKAVGVARPSLYNYLDLLENTYLIKKIYPYKTKNTKYKTKSISLYFLDNGLLNTLLFVNSIKELNRSDLLQKNLKTFVLVNLLGELSLLPNQPSIYYWQDYDGHEITFIFDFINFTFAFVFEPPGTDKRKFETTIKKFVTDAKSDNIIIFKPHFELSNHEYSYKINHLSIASKKILVVDIPIEFV